MKSMALPVKDFHICKPLNDKVANINNLEGSYNFFSSKPILESNYKDPLVQSLSNNSLLY